MDDRWTTPRGVALDVDVHRPTGPLPYPALVLAPGRGYHKDLPLVQQLCAAAAQRGWLAVRFDWAYQTADGQPSGGDDEVEDLMTVLAKTRSLPEVDPDRVVLGGKSMGSAVAWHVFAGHPQAACMLLTPLLADVAAAQRSYPGLSRVDRPVLMLGGKKDPFMKGAGEIGRRAPPNLTMVITGGDHGLCDQAQDSKYAPLAIELALAWAESVV